MRNEHLTPRETPLAAGDAAPDFTLLDQARNEFKLSEKLEQVDVVLCFFPMAFTEVCSAEMDCVHREIPVWQAKGLQVVGVSADSFAVQKAWSDQTGYTFPLLADMHREVCKGYGLYWPDLNVASRGTVIVTKGEAGPTVKWSQAREVGNAMDFEEVLAAMA